MSEVIDVDAYQKKRKIEIIDSDDEDVIICKKKPRKRNIKPHGVEHLVEDPMRLLVLIDPITETLKDVAAEIIKRCFPKRIQAIHSVIVTLSSVRPFLLYLTQAGEDLILLINRPKIGEKKTYRGVKSTRYKADWSLLRILSGEFQKRKPP